jgi:hypothetical protein
MTFRFPEEQRVLTPQEYAALGYVQRGVLPPELSKMPNAPLSKGLLNIPAYRADTKEQYYVDLGVGLIKVGYAVSTGGLGVGAKTALGYTWSILT